VADVHKNIELGNYVGEPDTAKDFTGFWKTDCEDGFGLQIKHYGTDGKYSIVFCGRADVVIRQTRAVKLSSRKILISK